jgi:hypothetical protein
MNHMSSYREAFIDIDTAIHSTIKFVCRIKGRDRGFRHHSVQGEDR